MKQSHLEELESWLKDLLKQLGNTSKGSRNSLFLSSNLAWIHDCSHLELVVPK